MAQSVATLKALAILDATGLVAGLDLTKKEMREAAKVAENSTDSFKRLEQEQAKLLRFAQSGNLNRDQFAAAMGAAEERFIPLAELVPEKKKLNVDDFLGKGFDRHALGKTGVDKFSKDIDGVGTSFSALPFAINPATAAIAAFTTGAAVATGVVAGLGAVVVSRITEIDNLGDAATRLGIGAGELSSIKTAAILGDVDPATTDSLIQKMLVNLGKGSDAFAAVGLKIDTLKGKGTAEIFSDVSAAISAIPDKAGQFAAMTEIFGKSGPEAANLIVNFARLREEALATGAVVGDQLAARVSDADDAMTRANLTAEGWANTLTHTVAPAIEFAANAAAEFGQSREGTTNLLEQIGRVVGGNRGALAGVLLGDFANDQRDALIKDAKLSQKLKDSSDAINRSLADEKKVRQEIVDLEREAETSERKRAESVAKVIQGLQDENAALQMNNAERLQLRLQRMGSTTDEQDDAMFAQDMLDFARQKKQIEDDAAKNNMRNQQAELDHNKAMENLESREAIRQIDAAEKVKDSLKTELQLAQERTEEAKKLHDAGLLTDAELAKSINLDAARIAGQQGGPSGVGFAEKGTAAGRTAVIEAGHQARQVALLEQIAESLRIAAGVDPIVIKEVGE